MKTILKSPYPWFGGKAQAAALIWQALGDVPNYVEPFFGGGAVPLARPHAARIETINDLNAWLCNFWRAVKSDPDAVATYASDPVSELDLHSRGDWLFYRAGVDRDFVERLRGNPDWFDAKSAGWWVWGQCSWIGDNWGRRECRSMLSLHRGKGLNKQACNQVWRQTPYLSSGNLGINRQRPAVGDAGRGVNRQIPHVGNAGMGVNDDSTTGRHAGIRQYMRELCDRMARVRICCGDWSRVLGETPTIHNGLTGVLLDPPYGVADRDSVYGENESISVAADVRAWCLAHGGEPLLRIALCGYDGEHNALETVGWRVVEWKARGGYGSQNAKGNDNGRRERIWFSPKCLDPQKAATLF